MQRINDMALSVLNDSKTSQNKDVKSRNRSQTDFKSIFNKTEEKFKEPTVKHEKDRNVSNKPKFTRDKTVDSRSKDNDKIVETEETEETVNKEETISVSESVLSQNNEEEAVLTEEEVELEAAMAEILSQIMQNPEKPVEVILSEIPAEDLAVLGEFFEEKGISFEDGLEALKQLISDEKINLQHVQTAEFKEIIGSLIEDIVASGEITVNIAASEESLEDISLKNLKTTQKDEVKNNKQGKSKPQVEEVAADVKPVENLTGEFFVEAGEVVEAVESAEIIKHEETKKEEVKAEPSKDSSNIRVYDFRTKPAESTEPSTNNNLNGVSINLENQRLDTQNLSVSKTNGQVFRDIPEQDVINQITESAKFVLTDEKSEMVMELKPDNLGKLTVKMVTERGEVIAQFEAENQRVKEIIESNLLNLKEALQGQGLAVQSCSVSVGQQGRGEQQNFQGFRFRNNNGGNKIVTTNVENYEVKVKNPYEVSESKVDFTA